MNKNFFRVSFIALSLSSVSVLASTPKTMTEIKSTSPLESRFKQNLSKDEMMKLKADILNMKGKSVETLISVMKDNSYPEKNRWMATFLLGQVMGKKAAPFISKFSNHPDWIMRMAALKTLAALKQVEYSDVYKKMLSDKSMIVRYQALETVKSLSLTDLAPNVWAMLYDKQNYHIPDKLKQSKRTHIIRKVITTVGELGFDKAKKPLLAMIAKDKYKDIHQEIDESLQKLFKKRSPEGDMKLKKAFWKKIQISETLI